MSEQADEILIVHSLRQAQRIFGVGSADTIRQWAMSGRLDAMQEPGPQGKWTIRIPPDHPDLPQNKVEADPTYYTRVAEVSDEKDVLIAELRTKVELLESERDFLRAQQQAWQQQLPELILRMMEASKPPALPEPSVESRRRWYYLWLA